MINQSNRVGTPEHERKQRQWFRLSQEIAASLMQRVLNERDLDDLLERDPAEDRHTERCLRQKGQQAGLVASYVALGILEGLEDAGKWNDDSMYGEIK